MALSLLLLLTGIVGSELAWYGRGVLQSDMQWLLPEDARNDALTRSALQQRQLENDRNVIAMVGANDATDAKHAAQMLSEQWQSSGLFAEVMWQNGADITALRLAAMQMGSYLLSPDARAQLIEAPRDYVAQRASDLLNPFISSLLPPSQDVLGFSRFYQPPSAGQMQVDYLDGSVSTTEDGKYWLLVRARLHSFDGITAAPQALPELIDNSRHLMKAQGAVLHVAAPALLNAAAAEQGRSEGKWLSVCSIGLTIALFALIFRRWLILWLLLPVVCGLLAGIAVVIALFGGIHIMTLLIGSSLVGLLLDVPLHWLGKAKIQQDWQPHSAMQRLRKPFLVSTIVTLLGYLMLLFTPLPVLRQTAVYALVALTVSVVITFTLLPSLFVRYQNGASESLQQKLSALLRAIGALRRGLKRPWSWLLITIFVLGGWVQVHWQEDIRNWVRLDPNLLADMQAVQHISGNTFAGAFFLIDASTDDELITRNIALMDVLNTLQAQGKLDDYAGIGDWGVTTAQQQETSQALQQHIGTDIWSALQHVGVEAQAIDAALAQAAVAQPITLADAMGSPLAEPWQDFYLGRQPDGRVASWVRLSGVSDLAALARYADTIEGVRFVSPRLQVSDGFDHTRQLAIILKMVSLLLAALLLTWIYGLRNGLRMLAVPLAGGILAVATLGWLGMSLSAFAVFGLLLVMAIGVDYAVYAFSEDGDVLPRLAGMALALLTTILTFGLLAFSSTPVVAGFGSAVAFGVSFSALIAALALGGKNNVC